GKIDVPRRIEQIQPIGLTRLAFVTHRYRMRFDCDPPLPFKVHRIKKLVLPLTILDRASALQQPVGQGRFAVIDVRNDAKIPRQLKGHESATIRVRASAVNLSDYSEPFAVQLRSLRAVPSLSAGRQSTHQFAFAGGRLWLPVVVFWTPGSRLWLKK